MAALRRRETGPAFAERRAALYDAWEQQQIDRAVAELLRALADKGGRE
ncbi:hypothetical protein ACFYT4_01495 [Streptomyces sp. NPDC004609]